jgi:Na+/H+ antiporter NhaD/arsenite permease-like protein
VTLPQIASAAVALAVFVALAAGGVPFFRLNRAAIAMLGAAALLALGVVSMAQAERAVDLGTLVLLLSMMVINGVLELGGFFTWAGELIIERASSPLALLILVVLTSGVLSALFLNDPVCLMLTPLVCGVALRLNRNPMPYLIAVATAANVGSTATITGNPQNLLIGASSGIPYLAFLARLGPVALVGLAIVVAVIWLLYPQEFRPGRGATRAQGNPPNPSSFAAGAAPRLAGQPLTMATAASTVYAPVLRKSLVVVAGLLAAFVAGVPVALAAFLAACALLLTRRIKSEKVLLLVDWPLLVLFGGLFVVTGALELTGVSDTLFSLASGLAQGGVVPLTAVAVVLSNTISNVPAVLLFRPLIPQFADPTQAWLTLAAASTLAGNLTLIGSIANLIVAEQALKFGLRLTFREYLRCGIPITALTLLAAVMWLSL